MQDATSTAAKRTYLKALADGIRDAYGCCSLHMGSEAVSTCIEKKGVSIQVEIFKLVNCQVGAKCFAWFHPPGDGESGSVVAMVMATGDTSTSAAAIQSFVAGQAQAQGV